MREHIESSSLHWAALDAPVPTTRQLRQDAFGKIARVFEVRLRGFTPDEVGVRSVRNRASNCGFDAAADAEEAFGRALAGDEFAVARIDVLAVMVEVPCPDLMRRCRGRAYAVPNRIDGNLYFFLALDAALGN